jgi:methionine synthase I (cobalamin-dependent)
MRTPFLQELDTRVLVCDGAMGTMLYARGIFLNRSFDELNLTQPDLVAKSTRHTCGPAPTSSRPTRSAPTA